jgi:hypothetical protein
VLPFSTVKVPLKLGVFTFVMSSLLDDPVSVVSTGVPTTGGTVLTTIDSGEDVAVLPAISVALAVIECDPSANVGEVNVHDQLVPEPVTVAAPSDTAPSKIWIVGVVLPSSTVNVPLKPGVFTFVMSSLLDAPVSVVSTGVPTTGAAVSTTTTRGAELAVLPAISVALAVIECDPSANVGEVNVHDQLVPEPVTVAAPSETAPSKI